MGSMEYLALLDPNRKEPAREESKAHVLEYSDPMPNKVIGQRGQTEISRTSFMVFSQNAEAFKMDEREKKTIIEQVFTGTVSELLSAYGASKADAYEISKKLFFAWDNKKAPELGDYEWALVRMIAKEVDAGNSTIVIDGYASLERTPDYIAKKGAPAVETYAGQVEENKNIAQLRALAAQEGLTALLSMAGLNPQAGKFQVRSKAVDIDIDAMYNFLAGEAVKFPNGKEIKYSSGEQQAANDRFLELDYYIIKDLTTGRRILDPNKVSEFNEVFLSGNKETGKNPYLDRLRGASFSIFVNPSLELSTSNDIKLDAGKLDGSVPVSLSLLFGEEGLDITAIDHSHNSQIEAWIEDKDGKKVGGAQVIRPTEKDQVGRVAFTLPASGAYSLIMLGKYFDADGNEIIKTGITFVNITSPKVDVQRKKDETPPPPPPPPPRMMDEIFYRELVVVPPIEGIRIAVGTFADEQSQAIFGISGSRLANAQLALAQGIVLSSLGNQDKNMGKAFLDLFPLKYDGLNAADAKKAKGLFEKGDFAGALGMMGNTKEGKNLFTLAEISKFECTNVVPLFDAQVRLRDKKTAAQVQKALKGEKQDGDFLLFNGLDLSMGASGVYKDTYNWDRNDGLQAKNAVTTKYGGGVNVSCLMNIQDAPIILGIEGGLFNKSAKPADLSGWDRTATSGEDIDSGPYAGIRLNMPVNKIIPFNLKVDDAFLRVSSGNSTAPKMEAGFYKGLDSSSKASVDYGAQVSASFPLGFGAGYKIAGHGGVKRDGFLIFFAPTDLVPDWADKFRVDTYAMANPFGEGFMGAGAKAEGRLTQNISISADVGIFLKPYDKMQSTTSGSIEIKINY